MESGNIRHAVIQGFLWFCLIASVIALIALLVFSFLQLASGNQTFGLSTLAFSSLFGAVIVAILNWVYFEPQGAEKERERDSEERQYQRERDADERKYERDRDKAEQERKEEHEQKVTEGQKLQLRKALYNEIVIVYCKISNLVDSRQRAFPAQRINPRVIQDFFDFSLYEWTMRNTPLLFWQLEDAQAIATFYRIMQDALTDALRSDTPSVPGLPDQWPTFEHVLDEFELALCSSLTEMLLSEANFDLSLFSECGALWRPCIKKLNEQLRDRPKLMRDCSELQMKRLAAILSNLQKTGE